MSVRALTLSGDLDITTCDDLALLLSPWGESSEDVVLECAGVRFADCAGLSPVLSLAQALGVHGGALTLRHLSPEVALLTRTLERVGSLPSNIHLA